MKLEIYKKQDDLMCNSPNTGEESLMELALGMGFMSVDQIKKVFGPEMPEIEVRGELDKEELEMVENMKAWFVKKYK